MITLYIKFSNQAYLYRIPTVHPLHLSTEHSQDSYSNKLCLVIESHEDLGLYWTRLLLDEFTNHHCCLNIKREVATTLSPFRNKNKDPQSIIGKESER